jgi:hypothetical protein
MSAVATTSLNGDAGRSGAAGRALGARVALPLMVAGGVLSAVAVFHDTTRFAFGYLVAFCFVWSVALGALFWVALHHLTRAVWSVVVRRAAEALAAGLPVLAFLFLPIVLLSHHLFPWLSIEYLTEEPLVAGKTAYLNLPFFVARAVVYLIVWIGFGLFFVRASLRQDVLAQEDGGAGRRERLTRAMRSASAPFMILFALTATFASFDWLMSLEPRWFSTILGVYVFAGMAVAGLAATTLLVLGLVRWGAIPAGLIRGDHRYNLGALLFAFSCFWGYIAMSQYLLIWYANVPEETFWLVERTAGGWGVVGLVLAILRFVVPFFSLLSRPSKSCPRALAWVASIALAGQWVDLHWLAMPEAVGAEAARDAVAPVLSWHEIGPTLFALGTLILVVGWFVSRFRTVAIGDPFFEESKGFHLPG